MQCAFRYLLCGAASLALWSAAAAETARLPMPASTYEREYPVIGYSGPATHNRVWQLQQRLDSGEVKLDWEPGRGYLRSLLKALEIDPDTQVLVYSRTSLQFEDITDQTPRAVYFNDDTYVGFVQNTPLIELMALDAQRGPVFFAFDNRREVPASFGREGLRCLSCHDTFSMMGGGVPRVLVMSAPVDDPAETRSFPSASEVDDRTPLSQRWGGWYITGRTGAQSHFGNLPLREASGGEQLRALRSGRLDRTSLKGYLDTAPYLTDQSDVTALLVLEHQAYIQNLITRLNYKVSSVIAREGSVQAGTVRRWRDVSPQDQTRLRAMMEPVVRALFFHEAAPFEDRIEGSSGFTSRFQKLGPRDSKGRSLREFDLKTRLFRYLFSYEIYSAHFDALPEYALDYLYGRIAEVLQGSDTTGIGERISPADRAAIREILIDTKPALAQRLK